MDKVPARFVAHESRAIFEASIGYGFAPGPGMAYRVGPVGGIVGITLVPHLALGQNEGTPYTSRPRTPYGADETQMAFIESRFSISFASPLLRIFP